MGIFDKFQEWLDEPMTGSTTRREFAELVKSNPADLQWAFCAGYTYGQRQAAKKLLESSKEVFKNA